MKIDENQKVPVVFLVLFEPLNEHVPDNSRFPKRVFLFIQEFLYVTIMSDMSRIVRNMFEFKCGNQQNLLNRIQVWKFKCGNANQGGV